MGTTNTIDYGVLWVPIAASLVCLVVKGALSAAGVQPFNARGMPSGHAAVMAALLTHLALRMPDTMNALGVAIAFSALYGSDLLLFYYGGPKAKDGLPLGHTVSEVAVGVALGVVVALIYNALGKKEQKNEEIMRGS